MTSNSPEGTAATAPAAPDDSQDLGRDGILAAPDLKIERHYIAEWGGYVNVRSITGEARDRFEASLLVPVMEIDEQGKPVQRQKMSTDNIRAKLLVECLCDKAGTPLFSPEDVAALGKKSAAGLTKCYNHASKLNAVSEEDVNELAKNSNREATAGS